MNVSETFGTIEQVYENSVDYSAQLNDLNLHMVNMENIGITCLIALGLCFGAICAMALIRYLKG